MVDLTVYTETGSDDDQSWLGSDHGTDATDSIMLAGALFTGVWTDGRVPSGVAVAKITAAGPTLGMYGPYDDAASDGRQVFAGFLYTHAAVIQRQGIAFQTNNVGGALLWHGEIVQANLPAQSGVGSIDAAGKVDNPLFRYV